jgi:pyruvyl transferase EpsO
MMQSLRERVGTIAKIIPRDRPVVYLDYPVHTNIGDLLIERGTEQFFREGGYNVVEQRSAHDFCDCARANLPPDATIVLHGGGNFGDLYELHQAFRERVIQEFPSHRIVMLPQTIYFESPKRLNQAIAVFSRHDNLTVCVRDYASLELFRRHFQNPVHLIPDMAHCLWGEFPASPVSASGGRTLLFSRTDKESRPMDDLPAGASAPTDWQHVIAPYEIFAFRALRKLHYKHCAFGGQRSLHPAWRLVRDRLIVKGRRLIEGYDVVITNRLHAAILGLLLNREVVMMDNSNRKLSEYYATWLKDVSGVRFSH